MSAEDYMPEGMAAQIYELGKLVGEKAGYWVGFAEGLEVGYGTSPEALRTVAAAIQDGNCSPLNTSAVPAPERRRRVCSPVRHRPILGGTR